MPLARLLASIVLALGARGMCAQALSRSDSALVVRILLAEDRRDASDPALAQGVAHSVLRIRTIAERAQGRIADPKFAARTSLPALPAAPSYPDPAWRLRLRALNGQSDCTTLRAALADSAWPVRLRATDLAADRRTRNCVTDPGMVATFAGWIDALPADASTRTAGNVSWHGAAHAIRALARMDSSAARTRLSKLARHSQWQVRMYADSAAVMLGDTATIRALAHDRDDNVKASAIASLRALTGHTYDAVFVAALNSPGAQAVRAAAIALRDTNSISPATRASLGIAFQDWVAKNNASARDARIAILAALGSSANDDRPPSPKVEAPPELAALALGADVRLRVTMSPASGGGGGFTVRLRGDVAPMMAARILALVNARYYDGLTWHRVEHDFVIQGGSPGANEYVGYKDFLRDELGTVPHVRGTVGMSTRSHDTGDAQWFINLRDNVRLNPDYTVFAEVTDGIGVVDGILEGDVIQSIRRITTPGPRR